MLTGRDPRPRHLQHSEASGPSNPQVLAPPQEGVSQQPRADKPLEVLRCEGRGVRTIQGEVLELPKQSDRAPLQVLVVEHASPEQVPESGQAAFALASRPIERGGQHALHILVVEFGHPELLQRIRYHLGVTPDRGAGGGSEWHPCLQEPRALYAMLELLQPHRNLLELHHLVVPQAPFGHDRSGDEAFWQPRQEGAVDVADTDGT
mmetsp:Transcript_110169/g.310675  ORF Transcript_110169/g.310675 Transcript_110169/m.310675 type:complete len:206 (-) Transcript_110169:1038-1655(-)